MENSQQFEKEFLFAIREASKQLQLEEFLSANEQQALIRYLGIAWFQAESFETARTALQECKNNYSNLPIHYVALCKSLIILMDECYPLVAIAKNKLCDFKNLMPYQSGDLLERLRHHYLIAIAYQNQLHEKYGLGGEKQYGFDITETTTERIEKYTKIYMRHFKNGLYLVLRDFNIETKYSEWILTNDRDRIHDDTILMDDEKKKILDILSATRKVKKQLTQKYEKLSKTIPLKNLAELAPDIQEVSQLIKGHLREKNTITDINKKKKHTSLKQLNKELG